MSFFKNYYVQSLLKLNKYVLVSAVFVVLTFMVGDSNIYKRYQYDEKIRMLEKEIRQYRKEIETNRKKLDDLNTSKERLERFAREEYFMKKPDEDIYIIE
ncbi:MAG: septum formation initiator family protein [Tannerella sp.]|jgi:cell division protein FtsB|nr:septum formation initiator family protein [Tannerella sp.]